MRTNLRLLLTLFVLLTGVTTDWSTDYHVSSEGTDSNPGTENQPWRSIARVDSARFAPGDRVLFRGGETFEGNLVIDDRSRTSGNGYLTLGSYGSGKATLRAGLGNGILIRNLGWIVIRDLVVTGEDRTRNGGYGVKVINDRPGNGKIQGIRIENVEASRFRWAGIYVGGIPTDLPGVSATAGARYGFRNVRIERCVAYDNMYYGIYLSASWKTDSKDYGNENVTIVDCLAHDNPGDPAYTANHSGSGILLDDTDGGLIEYCVSYRNGALNAGQTGGPCAIWTHASNRVIIQHCEGYANRTGGVADGGAFDLDGGVTNSVVQYCYSHDNDGPGYLMWNYEGAPHELSHNVIRYCISENDARKHAYGAIHIGTSGLPVTEIDVYHNTILTSPAANASPKAIWVGSGSRAPNANFRFYNNLFIANGTAPLVEIEPKQQGMVFRSNAYWGTDGKFRLRYGGKEYHSLEAWRTGTGQERAEGKDTGLFADPKVSRMGENETIGNARRLAQLRSYQLQPSSPLLGAGLPLPTSAVGVPTGDFWGKPVPRPAAADHRKPDIGVHQLSQ
ncbi:MAG: right-handed parallel beta-helix repeat-containing protein [Ferruginibacter sp.]|nr:right-handed parallel beta-helix repeat-containing protein [Cytophagales bacterium]